MGSTKDLIHKSISFEYDAIHNLSLALTREIEAFVKLDFFRIKKTDVLIIAYVESLIDLFQKMVLKHSFHLKKNQLYMVTLQMQLAQGYQQKLVNQGLGIRLLRASYMLINLAIEDRMICEDDNRNQGNYRTYRNYRNNGNIHYFEYCIYQLLENVHQLMQVNYSNRDFICRIPIQEYDLINREIIKLLRGFEEYPFNQKQYKHQCKKLLIEAKNILLELRDENRTTRKVHVHCNTPPPPWFADEEQKKDLFKLDPCKEKRI